jgi:tRNA pseudouridine38-40 synthase
MLIAYDGRCFRGWQSQATKDAVQDHLEAALARLNSGALVRVHGAGRTDAGVHGLGQVAHCDWPRAALPPQKLLPALNAHLPEGVRVLQLARAPATFHSRFDARGKIYTYRIWNAQMLHPLEIGRAWHVAGALDLEVLREAAGVLEGTHDFASFAANRGHEERDTVRTIHEVRITRRGPLLTLQFSGTGFLYRMVRLLAGSIIRCAQGKAEPQWLRDLLEAKGAQKSSFAAPAEGLYLTKVIY